MTPQSALSSESLGFVEDIYLAYLRDPATVTPDWREYFQEFPPNGLADRASLAPRRTPGSLFHAVGQIESRDSVARDQERVEQLLRNYRVRGHIAAKLDPLEQYPQAPAELDPAFYGFTDQDLDREFSTTFAGGANSRTLRDILRWLRNTYCRSIGVQYMHIDSISVRQWLQERMEATENRLTLTRQTQIRILSRLTDAVVFEEFLRAKYKTAKSFSLQGAESLIPLLDLAIEKAAVDQVDEIILAMAHRGRLNVLANIMGKNARQVFREFEDVDPHLHTGRGDVKYHLGHNHDYQASNGKRVHVSLCFNPSHLEFVNTVALGRLRAMQDRALDCERHKGLAILIHGDAAFAGEGVTQETLNLSQLDGYRTGGTLHIIINNQIGFTTNPHEARSTPYCTDVARMLHSPIFHVNGEDPEAVASVVGLALDFRKKFHRDVIIDMYCYRQHGHNESDEPEFTHPLMYEAIHHRKSVRAGYLERLLKLGGITQAEADQITEERRTHLENELALARGPNYAPKSETLPSYWLDYHGGPESTAVEVPTGVPAEQTKGWIKQISTTPIGFHPHPKLVKILQQRREMGEGKRPLDWATAEAAAFASLLAAGHRVRLSGQDSRRGTFSHRHAVLHDVEDDYLFCALQELSPDQGHFEVINSPLSEAGVLGFDYGYSLETPDGLVMWEAQFGDFFNAAQVIFDQFISSGEDKWNRLNGIVLLLPHGFEGQGPEHSSARLERFLQMAAEDNIQVCSPTTPAQYFHMLRRQVVRRWRKPLVVMTPKSLLRNPAAVSTLEDLEQPRFQNVLADHDVKIGKRTKRVLLCNGKVFYDLHDRRGSTSRDDLPIIRIEQLYPFPEKELAAALEGLPNGAKITWVQEEPENMGAWWYLRMTAGDSLFGKYPLQCVSRPASASPATGSFASHKQEQQKLIDEAFAG